MDDVVPVEQIGDGKGAIGGGRLGVVEGIVEDETGPAIWSVAVRRVVGIQVGVAWTLLPRVIVYSGPATPLMSCQPKSEAMGS